MNVFPSDDVRRVVVFVIFGSRFGRHKDPHLAIGWGKPLAFLSFDLHLKPGLLWLCPE